MKERTKPASGTQAGTLRLVRAEREPAEAPEYDELAAVAEAAAAGDAAAIRTLLSTLGPHLLRAVRRVLGPGHPDVDDVTQEAAFALMEALSRYRREATVLHFACRVAVLVAMGVRRRENAQKRAARRESDDTLELFPSAERAPDVALATQADAEVVRELLDSLPGEQAEVLALHCVLGYTLPEIAAVSRAPLETLRSRLRLAKHALQQRVLKDPRLREIVKGSP